VDIGSDGTQPFYELSQVFHERHYNSLRHVRT
jgi:hypothetical protein